MMQIIMVILYPNFNFNCNSDSNFNILHIIGMMLFPLALGFALKSLLGAI